MVGLDSIGVQQIPKQDIIKLTEHMYLLWKHHVTLVIDAYGLLRYISNTADVPREFVTDGKRVENSAFVLFRQQHKLLASWILTTVSMDVLPHLTGLTSLLAIWNTISWLLERLSSRDVVSWTSIISGSVLRGSMHEALLAFFKIAFWCFFLVPFLGVVAMVGLDSIGVQQIPKQDIVKLTEHTYLVWKHQVTLVIDAYGLLRVCALSATGQNVSFLDFNHCEHGRLTPFDGSHIVISHMDISRLLERLSSLDVVSWTSIISGSVLRGSMHEALLAFFKMQEDGVAPNEVTLVIDAYGLLRYISNTADVPREFVTDGQRVENSVFVLFRQQDKLLASWILTTVSMDVLPHLTGLTSSLAIWNTISRLLERLSSRDVISWTSIISGSMLRGSMHEALLAFFKMQEDGVAPNEVTIMSSLHACSFIGRLRILQWVHALVSKLGCH
ncbi:pentatricopeptide repeat-containing protein At2g03380, mitochondrial-like [Hibiscus syriacus]|uniref:pentatricopeptide repeat-containing protein At2g03380, mitochondrial-like n=1 Tax=Hibiscus syriacus TaxID=106335 RepID=UPI0019242E6C|nr:pentatricopeptide repeat-containing protein At2g03380, mitochondrial-like [Hibiscus syriacus]